MQMMNYFRSIIKEVKNINFPTLQDTKLTSVIIFFIIIISMFFIGFTDFIVSKLIKILLGIL